MSKGSQLKAGFYRVELNKTVWEIPERYQLLAPVGAGAYGQVWWDIKIQFSIFLHIQKLYLCL